MSTSQLVLNVGLLVFVLGTNLGTRAVTGKRLLLPVGLVLVAGWFFLQDLPTTAGDTRLELAGALTGVALGVAAAALMPVRRDGTGRIVTTAGVGYAVLWIAVIGGRIALPTPPPDWHPGPSVNSRWRRRSPAPPPGRQRSS